MNLLLFYSIPIYAYDGHTHYDFLTSEAAALLDFNNDKSYEELFENRLLIAQGSLDEDNGLGSLQHFYRPTDHSGLVIAGIQQVSAVSRLSNLNYYGNAISSYNQGQKTVAYQPLGHVLHLAAQDMFAIQHIFVNAHLTLGLLDFSPDGFETWVRNNRASISINQLHNGHVIPEINVLPTTSADINAKFTYQAVRLSGPLIKDVVQPAQGQIGLMITQGKIQALN